ncbi:MAG: hypothetical protein NT108_00240 [Candidatus Kaiserbacteria bacterium]|nr:hypothetical protein [Candidatus Kaiserbacteria bacterium]
MVQQRFIIAYELRQLPEVVAYLQTYPDSRVACLDFWVERELEKMGVSYVSLRDFMPPAETEEAWWLLAQNIAREWYRLPAMKFFEHDSIRIGEALEPMMEAYLAKLLYYVRIGGVFKKKYPEAQVYIPAPLVGEISFGGPLSFFEQWAVVDAFRMVGMESGAGGSRTAPRKHAFARTLSKSFLIRVYNAIIGIVPRRSLKLFASEYWSHIASVIENMDDAELVLMESSELKNIPWRQILKHRIRIQHPADATSNVMKKMAINHSEKFTEQWQVAKQDVVRYLSAVRDNIDWSPVVEACEYLITYSVRVVADIDALRRIMKEEKPNVVLQRASVGGRQHHFFLMARIARQLGIPSIELQHAGAYIDPRSVHSHIETDYLASYGAYTNSWYERIGYAPERLISIGSPRFDRCLTMRLFALEKGKKLLKEFGLDARRPTLCVAVPFSDTNFVALDSYALAGFFESIRATQKEIPGLQILFKFRDYSHVGTKREYLNELFPVDIAIAGNEDLFALLCASDAAICGNSTVIYEALLAQKPLVLYPWKKFDTYHAQMYVSAAPLARSIVDLGVVTTHLFEDSAYRETVLNDGRRFLDGYVFDGYSARRAVALLRQQTSLHMKYCSIVDLTKELKPSKEVRYEARKAQMNGLVVSEVPFKEFKDFYVSIVSVKKSEETWNELSKTFFAFLTKKDGIPVSGAAFMSQGKHVYYSMAVTDFASPYAEGSGYFLQTEVMKIFKKKGYELYVIGL